MNKYVSAKKIIFTALLMILLSCVILGYSILGGKKSEAYSAVPTDTTAGAIYDFENYCYDTDNLNKLSQQILSAIGNAGTTLSDLITYTKNTAGEMGKPIAGNTQITLQYGRYRFSNKSSYKDLAWFPVYLSRSTSGDAILTLYLAATDTANKSTSQQEAGYFAHDGNYSTNTANNAPSNSYGSSFMRTVSLGNSYSTLTGTDELVANQYADYLEPANSTDYSKLYSATLKESNYNKFSDFVKGSDFVGVLYDDVVTPAEMKWQANESYAEYINEGVYAGYCWPNESYGTPSSGSYYKETYFDYAQTNKINYDVWMNDKVWLPSLTEVGTGDISDDGTGTQDTTNGIWKLTASKRSNTISSWLRTANTMIDRTSGHSTYSMFVMDKNGNLATEDVNQTCAIRPAIHLNLSKITDKTTAPVNLPEEVTSVYTGDFQSMLSVPEDQRKWYNADDMTVYFYTDSDCTKGTVPLNAGEYYMMVELKSTSKRYFLGEAQTVRLKSTKFVVEKAKIGVKWVYEDETSLTSPPEEVQLVGEFYQRDITAQNVPSIGMLYSNVTGAGIQNSPEWPDKIGWYKAVAYIIDDDIHNYNYELLGEYEYNNGGNVIVGDKLESHQFEVLQKEISQPYFMENGDTSLELSYKGKQYIQIVNVSSYVTVKINAVANGQTSAESAEKSQAALDKIVDMGIVNGVQTFAVEAVAKYTFTVTLKDTINTVWAESGTDTSSRILNLSIEKAEITVTFEGLPSSWESARNVEFSITALGVYNTGENSGIEFNVSYYVAGTYAPINVTFENGKYVFKSNSLAIGEYYIYVVMSGTAAYTSNYQMTSAATQKFTVVQTVANFTPAQVSWKYKLNEVQSVASYDYDEHDSESKALQLEYVPNGYYKFSLSLTEAQLKARYLKASYSGDIYVNDAGMHSVTVVISAYDKNVDFRPQTYTIYFNISSYKYDLSGIEWDYVSPFTYNGNEQKVKIKPETLPDGLTVVYNTGGIVTNGATDAGNYVTSVTFKVSDEYAKNYLVPNVLDSTTYINDGSFSFTCNWTIDKQEIIANWNTESSASSLFFVPTLQAGHSLVDYTYEHKEGSNWVSCDSVTSTSSNETYRVTAKIKSIYANNYTLSGTDNCEFEVAAGQYAVTIHVEINGVRHSDGDQLAYTGSGFEAKPVVVSSGVSISSYTVDYYNMVSGVRGSKLSSNPVDAGAYVAVINVTFSGSGDVGFQNETEFNFEIVKAELDLSALQLVYTHGGVTLSAGWDTDQMKWVDASGKEVVFTFEYDGTKHEIQLLGEESVPGLTVNSFTGNDGTNAGNYTAFIAYNVSDNFNAPNLSRTFNWTIKPATVNFENVKWGYIDSNGVEHEFGEDGAVFLFTRDEEKNSVNYTIALINLPSYLKDCFRYTTTSYTDHDFNSKIGNSFSAIGEYHTEVSVVSSYTDPTGNRESFAEVNFPENISKSIDWEIVDRELSIPEYNGTWVVFDDKIHDLVELSGMPKDELNYFNVEITFIDKSNTIYNDYEGYEGVAYAAHDAGTYIISFYKLLIKFNGTDYDDKVEYVWGQVEVEVGKAQLEVTWDKNGAIPVAKVKGIYVSDMIETLYYPIKETGRGASVSVEYIKTTNGEVEFEAEPGVTRDYANNLTIVMANNEVPVYTFRYEQFNPTTNPTQLDVPVIEHPKMEYTGSPITFVISDWDYLYKDFLYILEGDEGLTQTDVGVYHVTVSFIKYDSTTGVGNACWRDTDKDRSSQVLTFEITAPTRIPLDFPEFNKYNDNYTGSTIEFKITNWVLLQNYVDYVVTYKGSTLGRNIDLNFVNAGIYTIVFTIKTGSAGYWIGEPDSKEYTAQIQIIDPDSEEQEIMYPVFQTSSKEYTGSELEFKIDKWDEYYNMHIEIVSVSGGATFTGGTFKAIDYKEYEVVVRTKIAGEVFADGSTEYKFKFTITTNTIDRAEITLIKVSDNEYRIDNWGSFGNNLVITCDSPYVTISGGTIKATQAGDYKISVDIKPGTNAEWKEGTGPVELTFTAEGGGTTPIDPAKPTVLASPTLEKDKIEFNGNEITFEIKNWGVLQEFVEIIDGSLSHIDVNTYSVVLHLKNTSKAVWEGDSTADITLTFEIVPAKITMTTGEDGKPKATNSSGEDVNLNDYLEPHYYDPDTGEEVPADKLEDGKVYDVKYTLKNEEEFKKNVENYSEVQETLANTTYNVTYVKTGGVQPILIVTIAVVGVLVLLVIATIIVLAVKRRQYVDGYYDDDDYDDYD